MHQPIDTRRLWVGQFALSTSRANQGHTSHIFGGEQLALGYIILKSNQNMINKRYITSLIDRNCVYFIQEPYDSIDYNIYTFIKMLSRTFADNHGFELQEHSMSNRDPSLDPGCNHITQNNWPPGEATATGGCAVPDDVKGIWITTYFIQAGSENPTI